MLAIRQGHAESPEPLFQENAYGVTGFLTDSLAHIGLDGQLVSAVTDGHERTSEWLTIDFSPDLHQAPSAEELRRACHDHVSPSAFLRAPLERRGESLPQLAQLTLPREKHASPPGSQLNCDAACRGEKSEPLRRAFSTSVLSRGLGGLDDIILQISILRYPAWKPKNANLALINPCAVRTVLDNPPVIQTCHAHNP
jgi:hypothetical protein